MRLPVVFLVLLLTACASGDSPLRLIGGAELEYPAAARAQKIEGLVVVGYDVNVQGAVENARVISAQPPGVFDDAALQTVRGWRFHPRHENGKPVATPGRRSELSFRLNTEGDPYRGL